jgi:hypothetical protein
MAYIPEDNVADELRKFSNGRQELGGPRTVLPIFSQLDPCVLLTEKQVAALLSLSVWTVRSWRQRGLGCGPQSLKIGAAVRYPVGGLRRYLEELAIPARSGEASKQS